MAERHRLLSRVGSVRGRTTLAASFVVGVALVIAALSLLVLLRRTLVSNLDQSALARARDLAAQVNRGDLPASPSVPNEDDVAIQVVRGNRVQTASANLNDEPVIWSARPTDEHPRYGTIRPPVGDGRTYRVVAVGAGDATVLVALSKAQADQTVVTVEQVLLVGAPVLLVLVGATTWVVAGRSLRPVEEIRREVADITASALDRRVPEPANDDEVARLARTMNDMLGRLERTDRLQRRFVGDASHELRSPLATARTELEVALAHPEITHWPETGREVLAEVTRMQRLVHDLLFLARHSEHHAPRSTDSVSLADVITDVVGAESAKAHSAAVEIRTDLADVAVPGQANDLARLVRNLLENAVRHARSRVAVELVRSGHEACLVVEDDGAGIPESERQVVFERFARLDGGRGRDEGGSGLGLAIVRDVAANHGGTVEVTQRGAGARFVVVLPASPPE